MERSTIFNGKIHYFYGHFQLQTVSLPQCSQHEQVPGTVFYLLQTGQDQGIIPFRVASEL